MKKELNAEFKFLELPNEEIVLSFLGVEGIRPYGTKDERNHFHNLMEIGICRKGNGEIILDDKKYTYKKGTIVIIPPNYPHKILSANEEDNFWEFIYIKPSDYFEKICKHDIKKRNRYVEETECRAFYKTREEAMDLASEIDLIMNQFRIREYGYRECVKGLVYALFMEIIKINRMDNESQNYAESMNPQKVKKLYRALEFIEENYMKELRICEIAQAAYISETYLRRLFADCCSVSPMHYIKIIRIEAACKLIKNSDENINEIAYRVGFNNMTTFINSFKKIMGCTPKQWKQLQQQKNSDQT